MRRVNIRIADQFNSVILSLNRFLYVLKPIQLADTQDVKVSALTSSFEEFMKFEIVSKIEKESVQHFEVFEDQDWLV